MNKIDHSLFNYISALKSTVAAVAIGATGGTSGLSKFYQTLGTFNGGPFSAFDPTDVSLQANLAGLKNSPASNLSPDLKGVTGATK